MAMMPKIPQAWENEPDRTSPQASQPPRDPNNGLGGLLEGWRPPGWSLESSGLNFLLHPETVAQIDFGDKGDAGGTQLSDSISGKLTREKEGIFPYALNENTGGTYQVAQAGGPLQYPLRQVPSPRFTPERIPGYNTARMEADGNVYDHLSEPEDIHGAMLDIAARGRQVQVGKDYESMKQKFTTPMLVDKNTQFFMAPNSFPVTGWRGNTYKTTSGEYYIDRNGDGHVDVKTYYDPKTNVTMIDYGDGAGLRPYDPKKVLPPPYTAPPLISPRHR
jgi:hypothetical protein